MHDNELKIPEENVRNTLSRKTTKSKWEKASLERGEIEGISKEPDEMATSGKKSKWLTEELDPDLVRKIVRSISEQGGEK